MIIYNVTCCSFSLALFCCEDESTAYHKFPCACSKLYRDISADGICGVRVCVCTCVCVCVCACVCMCVYVCMLCACMCVHVYVCVMCAGFVCVCVCV